MEERTNRAESVLLIDEHALDKECINLPSNFLRYAHKLAEAKRDVIELKNKLEVVQADLGKKVRDNPAVYGLEKVTEKAIEDVVTRSKEGQAAQREINEAQHNVEMLSAIVRALEMKKSSLTMLVDLHGMGWHANVKVSEEGKRAVEDMTKRNVRRRHSSED
jgi:preprotein translocase subunit SecD